MNFKKLLIILPVFGLLAGCSYFENDSTSSNTTDETTSSTIDETTSSSFVGDPDDNIVTLFSINDFHGKIENTSAYNGIIALQGAIRANEHYESSSLILAAGDMWQGSYISGYDNGLSTTELMNSFSFSAMALGNHEFDWGVDTIRTNLETADFPFLCANLVDESTGSRPDFVTDHVVLETEGHKIGVVGAIGTGLESDIASEMISGYYFSSSLDLLQEAYDACIEEGAEVVVLTLHDDQNSYYTNSIQSSDIGFIGIFGGHSHSYQNESADVPYVQGGSDGGGYSYMVINLEEKTLETIWYEQIDDSYAGYADQDFINEVYALIESRPAEEIGYLQGNWTKTSSGKLVVRAMFEMAKTVRPDAEYDEESLIAYHNSGGIRGSYPSSDEPLLVTMSDIQIVSPFDNEVVLLPDRTISSSGLSGVTYPSSTFQFSGKVMDIVTINYVLNDVAGTMLSSVGAEPLKGEGEDVYYIYDVVADYIRNNSSEDNPLRAEDFV